MTDNDHREKTRRKMLVIAGVTVFVIAAVVVGVVFVGSNDKDGRSTDENGAFPFQDPALSRVPTLSPSRAPSTTPSAPIAIPLPTTGPTKAISPNPTTISSPIPTRDNTTPNPATIPRGTKVLNALAGYAPFHEEALTWLTDTDSWEPDEGDPDSDYLWLERYVMAVVYFSNNGPNWSRNSNWLSSQPVCSWFFSIFDTFGCPGPIEYLSLGKSLFTNLIVRTTYLFWRNSHLGRSCIIYNFHATSSQLRISWQEPSHRRLVTWANWLFFTCVSHNRGCLKLR